VTDEERREGRRIAQDKQLQQRNNNNKVDHGLSQKSENLLSAMAQMAQNLDINGLNILVKELDLRKKELQMQTEVF
jgi:TATA-binding protein-associated factor Taf7